MDRLNKIKYKKIIRYLSNKYGNHSDCFDDDKLAAINGVISRSTYERLKLRKIFSTQGTI
jgi:hypothetical protein